ncbi:diaminobutyrate acetyltransferase [Paenibacillus sp. RC67]|uniref:diaminobutyrate acetyltransferase n=1 Tax=Paenibacillus sp. RC67 TaxID=3039392 RepID=UPI0024ADB7DE|nr:diaminobutyrate acetyltransferase [Paenibacillus sp. RC67]
MSTEAEIRYRKPVQEDGRHVWKLVKQTETLDVNSVYCYILLCDYFKDSCIVAEDEDGIVGFVSAFRTPEKPELLFIWQIAVAPDKQRRGIGKKLLSELLLAECCRGIRYLETTISPSNLASRGLFLELAQQRGLECRLSQGYPASSFPQEHHHEEEILFCIGPIS